MTIPIIRFLILGTIICLPFTGQSIQAEELPFPTRFTGEEKFHELVGKSKTGEWEKLPIGERMAKFGRALRGTPYVNFTLEIDDHVEAPSVNFEGLDCWTYFETCLGLARMIGYPKENYSPKDLLEQIQFTRYRGGACSGDYLERIHYLAEWFFDNEARGVADDITRSFPHAKAISGRKVQEMTVLWKGYRYLKNNPDLRPRMARLESQVGSLPVHYIPREKVHLIEPKLQNGDILGIVTRHHGAFCSHVGMAMRTDDGVLRLAHATTNKKYRRVIFDDSISTYLKSINAHLGVIIARPLEVDQTVFDEEIYLKNLKDLTGGTVVTTH